VRDLSITGHACTRGCGWQGAGRLSSFAPHSCKTQQIHKIQQMHKIHKHIGLN
jgi:hypothetical protein